MNKAKIKNTNDIIDISTYPHGSQQLIDWANMELECYVNGCCAALTLCSYRENNDPAPYFKSLNVDDHSANCSALTDSRLDGFSQDDLTTRRNGKSAFNKLLKHYEEGDEIVAKIYNTSTMQSTVKTYNKTNMVNRKSKTSVGPILYDGSQDIQQDMTYLVNLGDVQAKINESRSGDWLNLETIGLRIKNKNSYLYKKGNFNDMKVIFIPKFINNTNGRTFSQHYDYFIIKGSQLIEKHIYIIGLEIFNHTSGSFDKY